MPKKKEKKVQFIKQMRVTLQNGTTKELKFYGKSDKEAEQKRNKARAEYDAGILVFNNKTTFAKWSEDWLETCKKPTTGKSHYNHIKCQIDKYFIPDLGKMQLCDIKLTNIRRCLNQMEGLSLDYINKAYDSIKSIFREAVENELLTKDPTVRLKRPKAAEKIDRRPLTEEERKQLKEAIPHHPRGPFFGIMLACGLRPGEVRALSWANVDLKKEQLTVKHAIEDGTKNIKAPKSKSGERTIPIPKWYLPILNGINRTNSLFVFPDATGSVISKGSCQRSWHSFVREIDLLAGAKLYRNKVIVHAFAQDLEPYNLRHTYCTELAEKGVDLRTAQYLMGHSDIKMTANIYSHVTNRLLENARMLINQ